MNRHERRRRGKVNRLAIPRGDSDVLVRLMEDKLQPSDRKRFIRVELYSHRRVAVGRLKSQSDIYPWECGTEAEFERKIEAIAGTMAENQNEVYHDNHEPSEVARAAKEAYREMKMYHRIYMVPTPAE